MKTHKSPEIRCKNCPELFKTESDLKFHIHYEHREQFQWNCLECSFQTNSKDMLKTHINFKHTKEGERVEFNCEECGLKFRTLWNLSNHKRDYHEKKENCVFYQANRCKFGSTCWKSHNENPNKEPFSCFSCKEGFNTINGLMSHRKKKHIELCKPCRPKNEMCRFEENPERCWFIHEDFQMGQQNPDPPLRKRFQSSQLNISSQSL